MSSTGKGSKHIDYSKWDRMNFSDSDGSDDSDNEKGTTEQEMDQHGSDLCRVTRLDRPSRVTVSHGQVNVVEETPTASASPVAVVLPSPLTLTSKTTLRDASTDSAAVAVPESSSAPPDASSETHALTPTTPTIPARWTSRGGFVEAHHLYWSQDRYTVVLRFQLPASAAAVANTKWDCRVMGMLPYEQRHAAVQSLTLDWKPSLVITCTNHDPTTDNTGTGSGTEYFRDHVAYPVHAEQNDNHDGSVPDWSVETCLDGTKYLMVTLYKATPVPNMTIWWRRPLGSCPEISIDWTAADSNSNTSSQQKDTNTFAAAWEQAHAQFRQGRQSEQNRIEVHHDVGDDDDQEEGDET